MQTIGIVIKDKFTAIKTNIRPGTILEYDRLVDITARPDICVGHAWPPTPDPNDLVKDHPCHVAAVRGGKVLQLIPPLHIASWRTVVTAGEEQKLKIRLNHNPHLDPSITLEPVPDGVTVNPGDPWPASPGAN